MKVSMIRRGLVGASMAAALAACGGARDGNQVAAANGQRPMANESGHAMPSGPFAQVETQMSDRMMAATGANASETWTRKMIEHHRGAVAMSQVLVDQGGEPRFVEMARMTIEKQQREIVELERMLAGGIDGGAGEANPFGQVEQGMHREMMAAGGGNISETWARKMMAHHQGAIAMSEMLIRQGGNPQIVARARGIAEDQRAEIAHLEAMLRGEAMPATAAASPGGPSAASRNTAPAVAREPDAPSARAPERPAPRATQRDQPNPASAPKQPPAPTPACAPEHRAMGHC